MIVNLMPHNLNVVAPDGAITTVPPSGLIARCAQSSASVGDFEGVALFVSTFGAIEMTDPNGVVVSQGLPAPQAGVLLVVSGMVRNNPSVMDRTDVASPGGLVRDAAKAVIGCRGLEVSPR